MAKERPCITCPIIESCPLQDFRRADCRAHLSSYYKLLLADVCLCVPEDVSTNITHLQLAVGSLLIAQEIVENRQPLYAEKT